MLKRILNLFKEEKVPGEDQFLFLLYRTPTNSYPYKYSASLYYDKYSILLDTENDISLKVWDNEYFRSKTIFQVRSKRLAKLVLDHAKKSNQTMISEELNKLKEEVS